MTTWWVNQSTRKGEARNDIVWAPLRNKAGNKQWRWESLQNAQVGDIIYHYTDGFIVGKSKVIEVVKFSKNPYPKNADWQTEGRRLSVAYKKIW